MITVDSSYIAAVEYEQDTNTLKVEFKRGDPKRWKYSPVSGAGYAAMMSAQSVGKFFAEHIRENPDIQAESY